MMYAICSVLSNCQYFAMKTFHLWVIINQNFKAKLFQRHFEGSLSTPCFVNRSHIFYKERIHYLFSLQTLPPRNCNFRLLFIGHRVLSVNDRNPRIIGHQITRKNHFEWNLIFQTINSDNVGQSKYYFSGLKMFSLSRHYSTIHLVLYYTL
jgi:hypothetical protein